MQWELIFQSTKWPLSDDMTIMTCRGCHDLCEESHQLDTGGDAREVLEFFIWLSTSKAVCFFRSWNARVFWNGHLQSIGWFFHCAEIYATFIYLTSRPIELYKHQGNWSSLTVLYIYPFCYIACILVICQFLCVLLFNSKFINFFHDPICAL